MTPSFASCVGVAGAACANWTSCSSGGWIANGGKVLLPSARCSCTCSKAKTIGSGAGSLVMRLPPMSKSRRSSIRSAPCRIEWRPSRWTSAMLWTLALCAPFSLLMSDMPGAFAWPLALSVAAFGIVDARRYGREASIELVIPIGRGQASCDGQPIQDLMIAWRGPLAFLRWRKPGGRVQRVVFWPDTLPSGPRRELRLATLRLQSAPSTASMAR